MFLTLLVDSQTPDMYTTIECSEDNIRFDLMCPKDLVVPKGAISFKIPLGVYVKLVDVNKKAQHYLLMPKSSMGSTSLRLSNSTELVDSTFRGELCITVDNIGDEYHIKKLDKLVQIVALTGKIIKIRTH